MGTTGPGSCNALPVTYNGMGERVKETGSKTYLYAGPGFRLNPDAPAWDREYWIEIEALGERIAYEHVIGGSLRTTGLFGNPSLELTPREREILIGLGLGLGLALLVVALGGIARAPAPARAGLSVGVSALMVIVPYQAWAGGGSLPPPISGTAIFRWVVSDAIGSSLVEIDATGTIVSRSAYRPFGGIEQQWGASGGEGGTSGSGSRTYYAGHDRQTDTGLVYMNARWMDPGSGGFISVDPVISDAFEPMAYNGYSYVQSNPINGIDPTGMYTLHTYTVDLAATGLQVHVGSQEISEGGDSAGSSAGSSGGGGGGGGGAAGVGVSAAAGTIAVAGGGGSVAVSSAPAQGSSGNQAQTSVGESPKDDTGQSFEGVEEFLVTGERPDDDRSSPWERFKECSIDQLGLNTLAEFGAIIAGWPIPGTKRFVTPGSSKGTSLAGLAANKTFGRKRFSRRLPTTVGGPFTGRPFAISMTKSVARFAGRAVPMLGWGMLVFDAASIAYCTIREE